MSFDSLAAESYGKIRADLEKAGTPIGPLDMMIAGHAKALGFTVVTNNTKEFERIEGLKLENWTEYTAFSRFVSCYWWFLSDILQRKKHSNES